MSSIVIGKCGRRNIEMDLDILLQTRALLQANSGGGKSYLIRRLSEQIFGKAQNIIIDPEDEFSTLREKFGYVLVGKGGETPTDCRSAALVAHRLLELKASAVCNLYDLKPSERHRWVRLFFEAVMNAPKSLWHPCFFILDEAHRWAPERGAGESEASEAVIDLVTAGRKRGFCAILASQRLGKLRKDASAELLNRLVGPTFEDIDLDRAADLLSVLRADRQAFFKEMKTLDPGQFYAFGRAITKERLLVKVGPVGTTHPEPGSAKHAAAPPPTPAKIKALLPKLADLPKEAEDKAHTEADLRAEIRSLKAKLTAMPSARPLAAPPAPQKIREVQVLDPKAMERLLKAVAVFEQPDIKKLLKSQDELRRLGTSFIKAVSDLGGESTRLKEHIINAVLAAKSAGSAPRPAVEPVRKQATLEPMPQLKPRDLPEEGEEAGISKPQVVILQAITDFENLGIGDPLRSWVAARAEVSHKSSGYSSNLSALKVKGYLGYAGGGRLQLTDKGRTMTAARSMTTEELRESCLRVLSTPQGAILRSIYEAYPNELTREEVAAAVQVSAVSSGYSSNLSYLRSAGMLEYRPNKKLKCADWLFTDTLQETSR